MAYGGNIGIVAKKRWNKTKCRKRKRII